MKDKHVHNVKVLVNAEEFNNTDKITRTNIVVRYPLIEEYYNQVVFDKDDMKYRDCLPQPSPLRNEELPVLSGTIIQIHAMGVVHNSVLYLRNLVMNKVLGDN